MITAEPLPVGRIVELIQIEDPQTDEADIRDAIKQLLADYQDAKRPVGRGFRVDEVAGGLQFRTTPENAPFVRRFLAAKPQRLSKPALETLAIIAYRQPVTKPEVEAIRGVDVGAALKNLLDRDFIRILGKKDEVGRPLIYGTTEVFLEFFGLRSPAELPTLREYHELDEEHQKEVDALGNDGKQSVRDLANAAQFLVERQDDEDIEALDQAVADADRARRAAEAALDPKAVPPQDLPAPETQPTAEVAEAGDAQPSAPEAEAALEPEPVEAEAEAEAEVPPEAEPAEAEADAAPEPEPADEPEERPEGQ